MALRKLPQKRFMCWAISSIVAPNEGHSKVNFNDFPEFKLFYPTCNMGFVWNFLGWDFFGDHISSSHPEFIFPRQIVLDFCIEMTK